MQFSMYYRGRFSYAKRIIDAGIIMKEIQGIKNLFSFINDVIP